MRVYKNITIPRPFIPKTQSTIAIGVGFDKLQCHLDHKNNECKCDGLYLWMDADIAMQFNKKDLFENMKIFNHGSIGSTAKEEYYTIIETVVDDDEKTAIMNSNKLKKGSRKWQMHCQLYTKKMILQKYKINQNQLPKPVRQTSTFTKYLSQQKKISIFLKNPKKVKNMITKTKWSGIKVFSKLSNIRRTILHITSAEFQNDLERNEISKNEDLDPIPIILFKDKNYSVHYVIIVTIDTSNVGISVIYEGGDVKVTGIHLDAEMIYLQHQWISLAHLKGCNHGSLINFNTNIDHLRIGNIDEDSNRIKDLKGKLRKYEELEKQYQVKGTSV